MDIERLKKRRIEMRKMSEPKKPELSLYVLDAKVREKCSIEESRQGVRRPQEKVPVYARFIVEE